MDQDLRFCPHHLEDEKLVLCAKHAFRFCPFFYGYRCPRCAAEKVEKSLDPKNDCQNRGAETEQLPRE